MKWFLALPEYWISAPAFIVNMGHGFMEAIWYFDGPEQMLFYAQGKERTNRHLMMAASAGASRPVLHVVSVLFGGGLAGGNKADKKDRPKLHSITSRKPFPHISRRHSGQQRNSSPLIWFLAARGRRLRPRSAFCRSGGRKGRRIKALYFGDCTVKQLLSRRNKTCSAGKNLQCLMVSFFVE